MKSYGMTRKQRKELKHSLKLEINRSEKWLYLANAGHELEAEEEEGTAPTRETVLSHLKKAKENISAKTEAYLAEIDKAIEMMS